MPPPTTDSGSSNASRPLSHAGDITSYAGRTCTSWMVGSGTGGRLATVPRLPQLHAVVPRWPATSGGVVARRTEQDQADAHRGRRRCRSCGSLLPRVQLLDDVPPPFLLPPFDAVFPYPAPPWIRPDCGASPRPGTSGWRCGRSGSPSRSPGGWRERPAHPAWSGPVVDAGVRARRRAAAPDPGMRTRRSPAP
jgi:hypothetical protein